MFAIVALMISLSSFIANAQRVQQTPQNRAQHLKESLSLTDEQTAQVQTIYENSQKEMSGLSDSLKGNGKSMRQARRDIMDKADKQIVQLLTDDQKTKFAELKKTRTESQPRMRGKNNQ
ncbi:MAG TPA: hypothetical protein VKI62_04475 [Bacteroidota bacterium]|nr:hypothetical protein [Bacteroidota bacterium]